jgi:hypothetical protein
VRHLIGDVSRGAFKTRFTQAALSSSFASVLFGASDPLTAYLPLRADGFEWRKTRIAAGAGALSMAIILAVDLGRLQGGLI